MRPLRVLQVVLGAAIVSSVFHYTDNWLRYDQYPQDEPRLVLQPMVPVSWLVFTAAGIWGYVQFRNGRWRAAAYALAFYSVSGLISPIHYTADAPLSDYDAFQHTFILTDGVAGLAVLVFAVWAWAQARRRDRDPDRDRLGTTATAA
jgi:hypothetical protein